jgi:glucuronate isomerase
VAVLPAWRPDKAMAVENVKTYNEYLDKLSISANMKIASFADLMAALDNRHQFFHNNGCRLSDHGIETFIAEDYTQSEIEQIFAKVRSGAVLSSEEVGKFKSCMLYEFGIMDHSRGWTQQFHFGVLRNNNTRLFKQLGADVGFDSIGDFEIGKPLAKFLDRLDSNNQLAKTILYNINPGDNELLGTMIGNFQDGSVPGKMQFGSGWWFLDQKDGMEKQINALSNLGLLSRFVGMLTDSRSFLSYTRHEYFRRTLCNILGNDVENGEIPHDMELLGKMVENICFNNAKNYFNF